MIGRGNASDENGDGMVSVYDGWGRYFQVSSEPQYLWLVYIIMQVQWIVMLVEHLTAPYLLFNIALTYWVLLVGENYKIIKAWLKGKLGEKHLKKLLFSVMQQSLVYYLLKSTN